MADSGHPPVKMLFGKPVESSEPAPSTSSASEKAAKQGSVRSTKLFLNKIFGGGALASRKLVRTGAQPIAQSPEDTSPSESSDAISSPPANLTLVCRNIPEHLNNKNDLKAHFERFGQLKRINVLPQQNSATILFANHQDAVVAKETGTQMRDGSKINIYWKSIRKQSTSVVQPPQPLQQVPKVAARQMKPPPAPKLTVPTRASSVTLAWVPPNVRLPPGVASIFSLSGHSAQERAEILEKVDKAIYDLMAESANKREHAIVGTCDDMCPERERYDREFQRRLSRFELSADAGEGSYTIDHRRALKEYSRSAADQREPLPYELRTPTALDNTMTYLLHEICQMADEFDDDALAEWADWYHFLWTRTRGIRKDITQQHLVSATGVSLMERCARFHAFCAERLAEVPSTAGFDQKLNSQNLTKCLQSLKEMYADLRQSKNVAGNQDLPELVNEAEFTGYRILTKLDEGAILTEIERVSPGVRFSRPVQFALAVFSAYNTNNYSRFFRMFREQATYFEACLMHRYLTLVRSRALKTIVHAYTPNERSPVQVPIGDVCQMLCFESSEECEAFLAAHGIQMASQEIVDFIRMNYYQPETWPTPKRLPSIVGEKQDEISISELINGGPLTTDDNLPEPASSFDQTGLFVGTPAFRSLLLELLETIQTNNEHHNQIISSSTSSNQVQPASQGAAFGVKVQWPNQQQLKQQHEAEQVEKTMAMVALSSQIFNELANEVVTAQVREIAFSTTLMMKNLLRNAEPLCDDLLNSLLQSFIFQIAGSLLNDGKADVALKHVLTAEISSSSMISAIDSICREIAQEVSFLLVELANKEMNVLLDDVARQEALINATYWSNLSQNERKLRKNTTIRILRQNFTSWQLQTKQLLSLREHAKRPFPTGPRLSLKEAAEFVSCSAKVLSDGQVVHVPFVSALSPEKSLELKLKTASMAVNLSKPPEKLDISFSKLTSLIGPTNYPAWALWKLAVVVPSRYRENHYILRNVESIFKSLPNKPMPRFVCSAVLVSIDASCNIKVEGSNLLKYHANTTEKDALIGASGLLIFDDALTNSTIETIENRFLVKSDLPISVIKLSTGDKDRQQLIEPFITKIRAKCSESASECIDFLIDSSVKNCSSAISAVQFVSDFLTCKVLSPIKADLHNRKVSEQPIEMPPSLTLSLYNSALDCLKSASSGVEIAPEIAAAIVATSNFSTQFVPLSKEEHLRLFCHDLRLAANFEPKEDFIKRSFSEYSLEMAVLTEKLKETSSWTPCLLDCISSRLGLVFSNCFGANSLMFFNQMPNKLLDSFQPPRDWLYEAEHVQVTAYSKMTSSLKRRSHPSPETSPVQVKRGISANWQEIEQLESELLAKRLRNKATESANNSGNNQATLLSRSHSFTASSSLILLNEANRTPLSEIAEGAGGGLSLMNNTTFIIN